jgi:hypothetical protein
MKYYFYILILLVGCNQNSKQVNSANEQSSKNSTSLSYYKCDYSKKGFDTILSSGDDSNIDEVWGINKSDIKDIVTNNLACLDLPEFIYKATIHIKKRYPELNLNVSSVEVIRNENVGPNDPRSWFVQVSFQYDHKNSYQIVPLLLDGRIILSNTETIK